MLLDTLFDEYGIGVMATAAADGTVNTAVYARPHIIDDTVLVWAMTEGRTLRNVMQNHAASYLFKDSSPGFRGVRLDLQLIKTEESGEMLESLRQSTAKVVSPEAGQAVTHAAWFKVVEVRPLI